MCVVGERQAHAVYRCEEGKREREKKSGGRAQFLGRRTLEEKRETPPVSRVPVHTHLHLLT
jgi:hypothetical protein